MQDLLECPQGTKKYAYHFPEKRWERCQKYVQSMNVMISDGNDTAQAVSIPSDEVLWHLKHV